jgi:hypothetical protein
MDESLGAAVRAILEQGKGEAAGTARFLPLVTLDSNARVGIDERGQWVLVLEDGEVRTYTPGDEHLFHEVLEWKRARFDEALEEGARSQGLPPDAVSLGFPATGIVRAVLSRNLHYLMRLGLLWLHPTELREMRDDIARVSEERGTPTPIKDLARRLLVPS